MRKRLLNILIACALLPLVALPFVIAQVRMRGYDDWEAIFISLGISLPFVVLCLIAYIAVSERPN